jgi:predicted transglutaminase-like cysteine proteinase
MLRALCANLLACSFAVLEPAVTIGAPILPQSLAAQPSEPFGLSTSRVYFGGVLMKWLNVLRALDHEQVELALCNDNRTRCASGAALRFLSIVDSGRQREGRARLGEINRAVNLSIRPTSDEAEFGEDVWSSPLATFSRGAGDCEDYAIAKYVALRMAGISAADLRIVIMINTLRAEGHAVTAARLDGHWLILDNRRMAMVEDVHITHYRPLFVIDQFGLKKYRVSPQWMKRSMGPAASGFS